jgi:tRNA threonylcarbamoyladenosine modification (KEOPS) complex  Pcc1 subunit
VYQMMYAGAAAPAIEQVLPLLSRAPAMPASMLAMQISLKNYSVLLDVILGVNHRVSADFRRFVHSWDRVTLEVEASFGDQVRAWIPRFLRYIQLCMVQYFNLASSVGNSAPLPPLNQLIHHVQMRNWPALPPLPVGYLADPPPARPAPAPAISPPGAPVAAPNGTSVTNLHSDGELVAHFQRGNTGLRNLTTHANARPLPTADGSSTQLCLAFALRGNCSSDCSRSATHRLLTAPERSGISSFLVRVGVA